MAARVNRSKSKLALAMNPVGQARYRIRQGIGALRPRLPPDRDAMLRAAITPAQQAAFLTLPAHDQAHSCRVYRLLARAGASDDVLAAGLLHDIGKVGSDGRVRLTHRITRVVLARVAPRANRRLARPPACGWRVGFVRVVHHPELGADRARSLGCGERVCWLIAHHEDSPEATDEDLKLLIWADRAAG